MYLCINILVNHIECILSWLTYILSCYSFHASVSGTGRAHRVERPELSELVGIIGSRVPDYRGRFLRGLQAGHSVGQTVSNSIKSHNHTQPTHTHSFSGQLVSTALSGTAAGQKYSDDAVLWTTNYYNAADVISGSGPIRSSNIRSNMSTKTANSSSVTGNLKSGTVSGSIGTGGGNPTDYTGSEETAPDHIYVRCLIRAKP